MTSPSESWRLVVRNALFPALQPLVSWQVRRACLRYLEALPELKPVVKRLPADATSPIRELAVAPDRLTDLVRLQDETEAVSLEDFLSTGHLESGLEEKFIREVFFPLYGETGLAELVPQHEVFTSEGTRRIDFAIPSLHVAIEIDGTRYHDPAVVRPETYEAQTRRQNAIGRQRWFVLRYTESELTRDPLEVQRLLQKDLEDLGWERMPSEQLRAAADLARTISPADRFVLSRWLDAVVRTQVALLESSVLHSLAAKEHVRVWVPDAMVGACTVAIFDLIEAFEHAAKLYGEPWSLGSVEVVATEATPEELDTARALVGHFWGSTPASSTYDGPRTTTRWRWSHVLPGQGVDGAPFDLVIASGSRELELSPERVRSWADRLSDSGRLLWLEPDAAVKAAPAPATTGWSRPEDPPEQSAAYFFERLFGHQRFNAGQWPIVRKLMTGKQVFGILPTGAGKSACFQLPALLFPGTTLVVAPLVSLLDDQVQNLDDAGLHVAETTHSDLLAEDRTEAEKRFFAGRNKLMYVTPERLQNREFLESLSKAMKAGTLCINAFVVDEAHVASEWGHDFRPSYLALPEAYRDELFEGVPLALLTASVSTRLEDDLLHMFHLDRDAVVRPDEFDRPEISYRVVRATSLQEVSTALVDTLEQTIPRQLGASSLGDLHAYQDGVGYENAGIVFTPWAIGGKNASQAALRASEVCASLRQALASSFPAGDRSPIRVYHKKKEEGEDATVKESRNHAVHADFKSGVLPLVVATKAFGMGIDKAAVRYTVHTSYPNSVEAFYQESGRSGRDREPAHAVLLWLPRAADCTAFPPRCVKEWECPFAADLCSFGVQANFQALNLPGIPVEQLRVRNLIDLNPGLIAALEGRGEGPVRLPRKVPRGEDGTQVEELLGHLKRAKLIRSFQRSNDPRYRNYIFCTPAWQPKDGSPGASAWGFGTHECAERLKAQDVPQEEIDAVIAVLERNNRRTRYGDVSIQLRRENSNDRRDTETEQVLYRLHKLDLCGRYTQSRGTWLVDVRPFDPAAVGKAFRSAIESLKRSEKDVEHLVSRWKNRVGAAGSARDKLLATYDEFIGVYHEEISSSRLVMLKNMEELAASKECRRQVILAKLNVAAASGAEGECCDNCAAAGGSAGKAPRRSAGSRRITDLLERRLRERLLDIEQCEADLATVLRARGLAAARDRCGRQLEEFPDHPYALFFSAWALHHLGDPGGASARGESLLRAAMRRGDETELTSLLRRLPPSPLLLRWFIDDEATLVSLLGSSRADLLEAEVLRRVLAGGVVTKEEGNTLARWTVSRRERIASLEVETWDSLCAALVSLEPPAGLGESERAELASALHARGWPFTSALEATGYWRWLGEAGLELLGLEERHAHYRLLVASGGPTQPDEAHWRWLVTKRPLELARALEAPPPRTTEMLQEWCKAAEDAATLQIIDLMLQARAHEQLRKAMLAVDWSLDADVAGLPSGAWLELDCLSRIAQSARRALEYGRMGRKSEIKAIRFWMKDHENSARMSTAVAFFEWLAQIDPKLIQAVEEVAEAWRVLGEPSRADEAAKSIRSEVARSNSSRGAPVVHRQSRRNLRFAEETYCRTTGLLEAFTSSSRSGSGHRR